LEAWKIHAIEVRLGLSEPEDIESGLAVKSKEIPLLGPFLNRSPQGEISGKSVAIQDESADEAIFWPSLSIRDRNRRQPIRRTADEALMKAAEEQFPSVVFFTAGLEAAGVPSWEIAEEITNAIHQAAQQETSVKEVVVIAGTDVQISSFQYTLNNTRLLFSEE
jgi:hypothetical protein